eukprot:gene53234-797_t
MRRALHVAALALPGAAGLPPPPCRTAATPPPPALPHGV